MNFSSWSPNPPAAANPARVYRTDEQIYLRKIPINAQGYERGRHGRYFGLGPPVWEASLYNGNHYIEGRTFRVNERNSAKLLAKATWPHVERGIR